MGTQARLGYAAFDAESLFCHYTVRYTVPISLCVLERSPDCGSGGTNSIHSAPNMDILPTHAKLGSSQRRTVSHLQQRPLPDTDVKVTSEGRPYLGAALGTEEYIQEFVTNKVQQLAGELEQLATIACTQPHAAQAAFTDGMTSKWTYLTRTMPGIGPNLLPLETIIRTKLIPALTGRPPPNETERYLFGLPARLGGIAMTNPTQATDIEFLSSTKITEALTEAILHQDSHYSEEVIAYQLEAKREVHKLRREQARQDSEQLKESLTQSLKRSMDLAQEKGCLILVNFSAHRRVWLCTPQRGLS